jgi:hypothetical protein
MADEPEDGLLGFHTRQDRDSFSRNAPGPFRRRIAQDGKTIRQNGDWRDFYVGQALEEISIKIRGGYE